MMQSVALTDSCQHDEDFVIVEALESDVEAERNHNHTNYNCIPTYVYDDDDDDSLESYDYCEDAYSVVPSVVQSYNTNTNTNTNTTKDSQAGLETVTFPQDFLDYPLSYNLNLNPASACVPKIHSPGIFLFPSEEANNSYEVDVEVETEAEAEGEADSVTVDGTGSIAASEISASTRDEHEGETQKDSDVSPSASGSSVAGDGGTDSLRYTEPEPVIPTSMSTKREESSRASVSSSSSSSVVSAHKKTQSIISDDSSVHSISSKTSSRVSNKKLRKQLKLAKKEKATAASAAAVPLLGPKISTGKKGTATRKIQMAVRSTNKKQVACATQGLADYREEVIRNNKNLR